MVLPAPYQPSRSHSHTQHATETADCGSQSRPLTREPSLPRRRERRASSPHHRDFATSGRPPGRKLLHAHHPRPGGPLTCRRRGSRGRAVRRGRGGRGWGVRGAHGSGARYPSVACCTEEIPSVASGPGNRRISGGSPSPPSQASRGVARSALSAAGEGTARGHRRGSLRGPRSYLQARAPVAVLASRHVKHRHYNNTGAPPSRKPPQDSEPSASLAGYATVAVGLSIYPAKNQALHPLADIARRRGREGGGCDPCQSAAAVGRASGGRDACDGDRIAVGRPR